MGAITQLKEPHLDAIELPAVPIMSRDLFARAIGLPVGVVIGWADRGYLPCISIGKYSLVNLELLRKQCRERDFS
ncbi:hypothetical protein [Undibacterium curvum]|uniref:hypothetical protein n=1 Tax=Undibacterium curvum TaxID=2762294 RepID=UPI003D150D3B